MSWAVLTGIFFYFVDTSWEACFVHVVHNEVLKHCLRATQEAIVIVDSFALDVYPEFVFEDVLLRSLFNISDEDGCHHGQCSTKYPLTSQIELFSLLTN